MKRTMLMLMMLAGLAAPMTAHSDDNGGKKTKFKKTQEVNFDEQGIDGVVRSPDGAYLLQKRGVKFTPLYKVEQQMESEIVESINYLK